MVELKDIPLNPLFEKELPADESRDNRSRQVQHAAYSFVDPEKPKNPSLIHFSPEVCDLLDIEINDEKSFTQIVTGAESIRGTHPYAMCYGGHQFGNWAGQLGDGRAINIAEVVGKDNRYVLQLKGAGHTPYSRGADGKAVLRSSVREYLMSEAMAHLGIPTTRALSLAFTGEDVLRDILYNGNAAYEPGAVVCRVSPSFIRFGNFEIFAARKDHETLQQLADFTIKTHYPQIKAGGKEKYVLFFKEVVKRSMEMVLHWQRVGFVHGVMNTDNMSILGLTIDYGPYGWLEDYNPGWTPNTTDAQHKRYRFGNQPSVVLWNLTQLANALFPLINEVEPLQEILDDYHENYPKRYLKMMCEKLGLEKVLVDDESLISKLEELLWKTKVDYTLFFRNLTQVNNETPETHLVQIKKDAYLDEAIPEDLVFKWKNWLQEYAARLKSEEISEHQRMQKMQAINPKYVLRNYMAHLAIEAAEKKQYDILEELFVLLKNPYQEQPEMEKWFAKRPDWAMEKVGCSMLSCSS